MPAKEKKPHVAYDKKLLSRFIHLTAKKRELGKALQAIEEKLEPVHEQVLLMMESNGLDNIKSGPATAYLAPDVWAHPKDGNHLAVAQVLKKLKHGDLAAVRINIQQLSALIREYRRGDVDETPPELAAVINVSEGYKVRVRINQGQANKDKMKAASTNGRKPKHNNSEQAF